MLYLCIQLMCYWPKFQRKLKELDRCQTKLAPFKTGKTCRGGIGCGLSERKQENRFCRRHLGQEVCTEIMLITQEVNKLDLLNICDVFL